MKTKLATITLLFIVTSLSAQDALSGLTFKNGIKKVTFENVSYIIKGDTLSTVRLTADSKQYLKDVKNTKLNALYASFNHIEERLDFSRDEITNKTDGDTKLGPNDYEYPIVSNVSSSIEKVRAIQDFPELKIFEAEQAFYKSKADAYMKTLATK